MWPPVMFLWIKLNVQSLISGQNELVIDLYTYIQYLYIASGRRVPLIFESTELYVSVKRYIDFLWFSIVEYRKPVWIIEVLPPQSGTRNSCPNISPCGNRMWNVFCCELTALTTAYVGACLYLCEGYCILALGTGSLWYVKCSPIYPKALPLVCNVRPC